MPYVLKLKQSIEPSSISKHVTRRYTEATKTEILFLWIKIIINGGRVCHSCKTYIPDGKVEHWKCNCGGTGQSIFGSFPIQVNQVFDLYQTRYPLFSVDRCIMGNSSVGVCAIRITKSRLNNISMIDDSNPYITIVGVGGRSIINGSWKHTHNQSILRNKLMHINLENELPCRIFIQEPWKEGVTMYIYKGLWLVRNISNIWIPDDVGDEILAYLYTLKPFVCGTWNSDEEFQDLVKSGAQ